MVDLRRASLLNHVKKGRALRSKVASKIGLYTNIRIFFEIFRSFEILRKFLRYLENFGIFRKIY